MGQEATPGQIVERPRLAPSALARGGLAHPSMHGARRKLPHPPGPTPDTLPFRHEEHRTVACTSCHRMDPEHGAVTVGTLEDCQSCHHARPAESDCAGCHATGAIEERVHLPERTFRPTVASPSLRTFAFRHEGHREVECATCHAEPPFLEAAGLDCGGCHEEHHEPRTACLDCHRPAPQDAHDRSVHLGCSGAGCHADAPVEMTLEGREGCLWCHQEMADHEPDARCASCHLLPEPSARTGRPR